MPWRPICCSIVQPGSLEFDVLAAPGYSSSFCAGETPAKQKNSNKIMIINILIGLIALIALFLIVVAQRPADFRVQRSATLAATPAALFEQVNDHRKFAVWNPFMKLDPNVKN